MLYPLLLLPFQDFIILFLRHAGVGVGREDGGLGVGGWWFEGYEGFVEVERGGGGAAGGARVVRRSWGLGGLVRVGDRGGHGDERWRIGKGKGCTFSGLFQFGCFCHAGWRCE